MDLKHIKPVSEFLGQQRLHDYPMEAEYSKEFINESRRPIEAHKVSKQNREIKIFMNTMDFNVPVSDETHISAKAGTKFVCIEDDVFVRNEKEDTYTRALFETEFIEINKKIFEEI